MVSSDVLSKAMNKTSAVRNMTSEVQVRLAEQTLVKGMKLHEFAHVKGLGQGAFGKILSAARRRNQPRPHRRPPPQPLIILHYIIQR